MGGNKTDLYMVFMNFDPEYERLTATQRRRKEGAYEVDMYLSKKHDEVLATNLEAGSYTKTYSLVIVDAFAARITEYQASVLRSLKEVRLVEKNLELP